MRREHLGRMLRGVGEATGVVVVQMDAKLAHDLDVIGRDWEAIRGSGADRLKLPLLNHY